MFRDIVYINYDYTLRIQDGYLIFRWWRSYVPKDVSEGNIFNCPFVCFVMDMSCFIIDSYHLLYYS